jgi:hypothetical protein
MKAVSLFLIALALSFTTACEKQPYSKLQSMTESEHEGHAAEAAHGASHEAKPAAEAEHGK